MISRVVLSAALMAAGAEAFMPSTPALSLRGSRSAMMASKINVDGIQASEPKVVTQATLKAGDKVVYCRCWKSGTFPNCDGKHNKHNEETGDNVGPLIVSVPKA